MQRRKHYTLFGAMLFSFLPLAAAPKPYPANSTRATLSQTAAVVEGVVSAIRSEYDSPRGPRTVAILSSLRVHLGSLGTAPTELRLESFGGRLPSGKTIHEAHVPLFSTGQHVVVLLRNTEWFLSPVVSNNAFSVESVAGRQIMVTGAGATLLAIDATGLVTGNIVLPMNQDGTRAPGPPSGIAPEPGAMGVADFIAAVRNFAAESGIAFAGVFNPSPVSNRPVWNRFTVSRATPPAQPVERKPCFANSRPGADSDEAAVKQCLEGDPQ
jgi:hypothetical protein